MKRIILFFLISFCFKMCFGQQEYEYVGFIKLNDSSLISLTVKLQETNGIINGYTLTDVGGDHETKTSIIGDYNAENKQLRFKEVETIYTKSDVTEDDFCYVNFTSNSYKLGKSSKLNGHFKGLFPDKTECINGEILLSTKEKQLKKIEKANKFIKKTKRLTDSEKQNIDIAKTMDSIQMNILRSKQIMSVFAKSKNIRIEIFDGGQLDGDRVTLKYNGNTVLRDFETTNQRKSIPLTLVNKKNTFILTADNVGTMSTNTAVIEIFVDDSKIRALTNLKAGEQTQIDFYFKN
ncbi:hypothetical protein [uncultured Lacinutrix sp.]|uniref:hypothetical protein n=1 Tax=uncultured Lacinutrix sp. TaxID=574032 RepID=UPI0026056157|nr:hypothetical protein [uncultured Lacinutrix sp.]